MIQANELRIGNWINYLSTPIKCDMNILYAVSKLVGDSAMYSPIPLTPEVLEACGFNGDIPEWVTSVHEFQNWYYWNNNKKEISIHV